MAVHHPAIDLRCLLEIPIPAIGFRHPRPGQSAQTSLIRRTITHPRPLPPAPLFVYPAQAEQVFRLFLKRGRIMHSHQPMENMRQRHNILRIMAKNIFQQRKIPGFEEFEVPLRHQRPGQIILPVCPQHRFFQTCEIAFFQPQLPDAPGRMKQIHMGRRGIQAAHPLHGITHFQQRQVKGSAIEGTYHPAPPQMLRHV